MIKYTSNFLEVRKKFEQWLAKKKIEKTSPTLRHLLQVEDLNESVNQDLKSYLED